MEINNTNIEKLKKIIADTNNIVFFGGAGVSTESGIPDFRSVDGLYNQKYDYPPEEILSHSFFINHISEFYKFYRDKMICENAKPNMAHVKLAEWEKEGKVKAVITQNIDGLHQKAGSKNVLELHGSVLRNYCMDCEKLYSIDIIINSDNVPHCEICGGIVKPDVVLYEEQLKNDIIDNAVRAISSADTLIIGGTSLNVYPAAGLIRHFFGRYLIIINKSELSFESDADVVIHDGIAKTLEKI